MDTNTMAIVLSVLAFAAIFTLVYAIGMPKHPNKAPRKVDRSKMPTRWPTLQAKLDEARIEVSADVYVRQSLQLGIPIGIGLFVRRRADQVLQATGFGVRHHHQRVCRAAVVGARAAVGRRIHRQPVARRLPGHDHRHAPGRIRDGA